MKNQRQLESSVETVFVGTKTELRDQRDQHQSLRERNTTELEEVREGRRGGKKMGVVEVNDLIVDKGEETDEAYFEIYGRYEGNIG